jgi:hypothetical protein
VAVFVSMPRPLRSFLTLLCMTCSLLAQPAFASAHVLIGIGDNKPAMFTDPRFLALGIKQVRYDIPWNAIEVRTDRAELADWLGNAHADGLTPLISFDHISVHGKGRKLPSVAAFSRAFKAFRKAYPWVTQFVTWDEANYYLEATSTNPKRAAQFYLALRKDCPACTILAADVLDVPRTEGFPLASWTHEFIHYAHTQPAYWGLNNYVGANRLETGTTEALLHAVRGKIWFAETGGIVSRHNHSSVGFPQNAKHAAKVDRFILRKLVKLSPRIRRVYFYEWNAVTSHDAWDSALISAAGKVRPAYDVLANTLLRWGVKPNCAISRVPPSCVSNTTDGPFAGFTS